VKVAYVLTEFPALTETFVTVECELLERLGETITPFTFRRPRHSDRFGPMQQRWAAKTVRPNPGNPAALLKRLATHPGRVRKAMGIAATLPPHDMRERLTTWGALPWCAQVAATVERQSIQHIHAHFARGAATLAWLVSTLADVPFSFTAHAFGVHKSDPRALARKAAAAAFVRATHGTLSIEGAVVLPTPIDLDALPYRDPPPTKEPVKLLCVARNTPKKGLDLLDGIALNGPHTLTVLGPGTTGGPADHATVVEAMRAADVFVLPCRVDAEGDRDGLPVVLLEAFALGVPAVSTRVAGIPELFEGSLAQQLAEPEDVATISALIDRVAGRQDIARTQREVVERRFGADVASTLANLWRKDDTPLS